MEGADTDRLLDGTMALVPPLLTALDALGHAGRHLHPPTIAQIAEAVASHRQALADGLAIFKSTDWPDHLRGFVGHCEQASGFALQAFDGLQNAAALSNPIMAGYRAMGHTTRAVEALYPVSAMLPPVSRYFTHEAYRDDEALAAKFADADPTREEVGVMHANNGPDDRGGFSLYVPEYYDGEAMPLVVALHGGSGHGRSFLWTWLRDARTRGAIVVSPSSREGTWSLMGPDVDSANLDAIIEHVKQHWNVDAERVLLTGMSDGATFSYVCGLRDATAYTHLAPCSASFHPMLLEIVSGDRLRDLPIYLMHGALDWMFPIDMARTARDAFTAAGAAVEFREIDDLSHAYPREENDRILDWLFN